MPKKLRKTKKRREKWKSWEKWKYWQGKVNDGKIMHTAFDSEFTPNCVHRSKTSFPKKQKNLRNEKVEKNKSWEAKEKVAHIVYLPITCMIQIDVPTTFEKKLRKNEKVEKMEKKSWKWKVKGPFYAFNSDLHPAFKVKLPQHS